MILVDPKVAIFRPANLPPPHIYIYIHSLHKQTIPGTDAGLRQMRQTQTWAAPSSDLHVYLRPLPFRILPFGPDTPNGLS